MREVFFSIIFGYGGMTILTFAPIITGIIIYRVKNGKEDKKIEQLASDLICIGGMIGIYWFLMSIMYVNYLIHNPPTKEKIISILARVIFEGR